MLVVAQGRFSVVLALSLFSILTLALSTELAQAQTYASTVGYATAERRDAAVGHYARTRALLVEALAEFEQGRRLAQPDMLVNSQEWRLSIISRAEDLNRLIDPRPRVTRGGVRFNARGLNLKHQQHQLPRDPAGPEAESNIGEDELQAVRRAETARIQAEERAAARVREAEQKEIKKLEEKKIRFEEALTSEPRQAPAAGLAQPVPNAADNLVVEDETIEFDINSESQLEPEAVNAEATGAVKGTSEGVEDPEVAAAIEAVIQERIRELSQGGAGAQAP